MSSSPTGRQYENTSGRMTQRERIVYGLQSVEDTARESLLHGGEVVTRKAHTLWGHFKDFIDNGNVVGLAVGLILGAAFTSLVSSLVDDIISPPLGLAVGHASLDDLFVVIKEGKNDSSTYFTLEQARDDGAVCIAYGRFFQMTFNFFVVAFALFAVIRVFQSFQQEEIIKSKVKCKYCRQKISKVATRCQFCTSWQDVPERNRISSPPGSLVDTSEHTSD
ncbi:hypothetical protein BGZ96_008258 [Linnemannia gamsii]|uniref:Gated mechanosensitive channel n=1 Tax=Linnemannia gamsii TaxID=64522 RepID=A0ABQ7JZQ4_9FUNG|nr:hypothetical protein BGZ96_008258 [Linnemannia gamsii]